MFWSHRFLRRFVQLFDSLLVVTEIFFAPNQDYRKTLAKVKHLGNPLFAFRQRFVISWHD